MRTLQFARHSLQELYFSFVKFLFDVKEKETEIIISLEQEDMRVYREDGKVNTTIGCAVLKVDF